MGEYAKRKSDNADIKIGTCESMYYLRYEDRKKVINRDDSLNPAEEKNLFWRLPFPDEDNIQPGEYKQYNRGERLWKTVKEKGIYKEKEYSIDFKDPETLDHPGIIQLSHDCGLLVNIPCYHGEKLPENNGDIKTFWNGKGWFYELAFIKNTDEGIKPIVRCKHCEKMWRYSWKDIMPYLHGELKERLSKYVKESK